MSSPRGVLVGELCEQATNHHLSSLLLLQKETIRSTARCAAEDCTCFEMLNRCFRSTTVDRYAAWDLAFHTISLLLVDFDFAKEQLLLMLRGLYSHPNGQIPAYEWNFSDVNPPVHAWATLYLYKVERQPLGWYTGVF